MAASSEPLSENIDHLSIFLTLTQSQITAISEEIKAFLEVEISKPTFPAEKIQKIAVAAETLRLTITNLNMYYKLHLAQQAWASQVFFSGGFTDSFNNAKLMIKELKDSLNPLYTSQNKSTLDAFIQHLDVLEVNIARLVSLYLNQLPDVVPELSAAPDVKISSSPSISPPHQPSLRIVQSSPSASSFSSTSSSPASSPPVISHFAAPSSQSSSSSSSSQFPQIYQVITDESEGERKKKGKRKVDHYPKTQLVKIYEFEETPYTFKSDKIKFRFNDIRCITFPLSPKLIYFNLSRGLKAFSHTMSEFVRSPHTKTTMDEWYATLSAPRKTLENVMEIPFTESDTGQTSYYVPLCHELIKELKESKRRAGREAKGRLAERLEFIVNDLTSKARSGNSPSFEFHLTNILPDLIGNTSVAPNMEIKKEKGKKKKELKPYKPPLKPRKLTVLEVKDPFHAELPTPLVSLTSATPASVSSVPLRSQHRTERKVEARSETPVSTSSPSSVRLRNQHHTERKVESISETPVSTSSENIISSSSATLFQAPLAQSSIDESPLRPVDSSVTSTTQAKLQSSGSSKKGQMIFTEQLLKEIDKLMRFQSKATSTGGSLAIRKYDFFHEILNKIELIQQHWQQVPKEHLPLIFNFFKLAISTIQSQLNQHANKLKEPLETNPSLALPDLIIYKRAKSLAEFMLGEMEKNNQYTPLEVLTKKNSIQATAKKLLSLAPSERSGSEPYVVDEANIPSLEATRPKVEAKKEGTLVRDFSSDLTRDFSTESGIANRFNHRFRVLVTEELHNILEQEKPLTPAEIEKIKSKISKSLESSYSSRGVSRDIQKQLAKENIALRDYLRASGVPDPIDILIADTLSRNVSLPHLIKQLLQLNYDRNVIKAMIKAIPKSTVNPEYEKLIDRIANEMSKGVKTKTTKKTKKETKETASEKDEVSLHDQSTRSSGESTSSKKRKGDQFFSQTQPINSEHKAKEPRKSELPESKPK